MIVAAYTIMYFAFYASFLTILGLAVGDMSRNAGNCENGKFDEKVKTTGENGGFGENSKSDEMLPKFLTKVEDIMQRSCVKGPIESNGYGENGGFGENSETDKILPKFLTKVEDIMQMS